MGEQAFDSRVHNVGSFIHALRVVSHDTVTELAKKAGISRREWLAIERGGRAPSLRDLAGIARTLRMPVGDLLTGHEGVSATALYAGRMFDRLPPEEQEMMLRVVRELVAMKKRRKTPDEPSAKKRR